MFAKESAMKTMKSLVWSRRAAAFLVGLALTALLPARLSYADEPLEDDDADAGSSLHLDDGVIHLDGATGDASADRDAQSGCSTARTQDASFWWLPLPFSALLLIVARRRARRA
jgi:hypothetical protein